MDKPILYVDLDDTVCEPTWPEMGPLKPGAAEAIRLLRAAGHQVIIFTCRSNVGPGACKDVLAHLARLGVEVDGIWTGPKPFGIIVDDRTVEFRGDWKEVIEKIFGA